MPLPTKISLNFYNVNNITILPIYTFNGFKGHPQLFISRFQDILLSNPHLNSVLIFNAGSHIRPYFTGSRQPYLRLPAFERQVIYG